MNVSSTFNAADGDGYNLHMGRWSRRLAEPFLDFAGVRDGESVLDVGCGTGSLALALQARCPASTLQGIDFSPVYVAHAARHAGGAGTAFEVGDACRLRFADASFDRVLSLLVLHFVAEPARAIAEMRRVARPGATLAATVWDTRGGFVAQRLFYDTAAVLDPAAGQLRARALTRPMTRPGELAQAWRAAGLRDVEATTLAIRTDYASFDDYWKPLTGRDGPIAAYMQALSADQRTRLEAALRLAYLDGEADGPRSYAAAAWAVKGRA